MNIFHEIVNFVNRYKFYLLSMILIVLYYFLIVLNQDKSTILEFEFSAEKKGKISVFWPDNNNLYSAQRVKSRVFSSGQNKMKIAIPGFNPKKKLRIDPDSKNNIITLHHLALTRSGSRIDLDAGQLAKLVSVANGLDWTVAPEGLRMNLVSSDPMLILKRMPFTLSIGYWLVPLGFLLLVGSTYRWKSKKKISNLAAIYLTGISVSLVIFMMLNNASKEAHILLILLDMLAVFGIVKLILLLEGRLSLPSKWKDKSLVLSGVYIFLLFSTMFLSLSTGTISTISANISSAFNENKDKGLNIALKSSRDAFENAFIDNFYLKEKLQVLNAESKIFVLGFSLSEKAIVGKDNWFFEGYGERRVEGDDVQSFDNITDYMGQNPFTKNELLAWKVALEERYYWLKEKGSRYIFVLAPTKALVYPEKLPRKILRMKNNLNLPTRYDQLINYLQQESVVPVVDLRKELLEVKKSYPDTPLFYRTDFHWNYLGSYFAYRAIIKGINAAYPELEMLDSSIAEFTIRKKTDWVHERFMTMIGLQPSRHKNDTYITLHPKPESAFFNIATFSKTGINDHSIPGYIKKKFGRYTYPVREIKNPDARLKRMVIIGDSFIEKTLGYFSLHGQETLNFRSITSFPVAPFSVKDQMPEIVVQEILNMYLLKSPPDNPKQIRKARVRALSLEERD